MKCRRKALGWMLLLSWTVGIHTASAQTVPATAQALPSPRPSVATRGFIAAPVPLDELPPPLRERVRSVLDRPTLASRGPVEAFHCRPPMYYWLLDHPDVAMRLWHGLGAKCTDIQAVGEGNFQWSDAQLGEVHWQTIVRTAKQRVWYAEGRVKPGVMLPAVSLRAVVVLNHQEGNDGSGKPAVRHQMDMILHTDSRVVNLAARLFGASAPRMAEEYVGQMEMFFGALAWYLSEHPEKAKTLFEGLKQTTGNGGVPQGAITPTSALVPGDKR
jgi:hypothetical protein